MDQNQGILQALTGQSQPGWANPDIQKSSMGQSPGPMGQMQGMGNQMMQGFQNSKFGQALAGSPIGQMFGQGQMPAGGMLGGQPPMQPPMMHAPQGVVQPAMQQAPMAGGMAPAMGGMAPVAGGGANPYGGHM